MEDKKLLTNEELEKVAGGRDRLDSRVYSAFRSAEIELESIIDDPADDNYRNNVNRMLGCCRKALDGNISAEAALDHMQNYCNQINIAYRCAPEVIMIHLTDALRL